MSKSTNCDCNTKNVLGKTFIINMCDSCKKELSKRDFIELVKVDTINDDIWQMYSEHANLEILK